MIIKINKNRRLSKSSASIGFIKENKIETIQFEIPEEYARYSKKACFKADNEEFSLLLNEDNSLTLTSAITKFKEVDMAIEFFDEEVIARTSKIHLIFEDTVVGSDVEPEEPQVIVLNDLIRQVDNMDIDANGNTITITRKDGSKKEVEVSGGTSEGGTTNYNKLTNKPTINGITLEGNKTLEELGIQETGEYANKEDIPTKTSELINDKGYLSSIPTTYKTKEENDKLYQEKGNYLTNYTETDPTVPSYVKNISSADITKWNNKSEFSGSYNDLTNKPTIPSKTSDLVNDSKFASENYVNNAIANAELGAGDVEVDLSGYATKDDLNKKVDKELGKSLITDSEIERLASVTNYDDTSIKNSLNKKANTSDIPKKVSQLENDENYIKEEDYLIDKETFLTEYDLVDYVKEEDLTQYAKKSDIEDELVVIPFKSTYSSEEATKYGNMISECFNESYDVIKPLFISYSGTLVPYTSRLNANAILFSVEITNAGNTIHYIELQANINSVLESIQKVVEKVIVDEETLEEQVDLKIEDAIKNTNHVSSNTIKSIVVVDELPENEEDGILYLVKE